LSPHRLLKQLAEEIDEFYDSPNSYDRKRIEEIVNELITELKGVFGSGDPLAQLKESLNTSPVDIWEKIKKFRRMLQSDEVDDYGCDRRLEMSIKPLFDFLYYKYFRVTV